MLKKLSAILVKPIEYLKDGKTIRVKAGTCIVIDTTDHIALINGDHVDVFKDEYSIES